MKFLLTISLLFLCGIALAQPATGIYLPTNVTTYGNHVARQKVDSASLFPTGLGKPSTLKTSDQGMSMMFFDTLYNKLWIYNPKSSVKAWDTTYGGIITTVPVLINKRIAFGNYSNLQTSDSNYTIDSANTKIKVTGLNVTNGYELGSSINYSEPSSTISSTVWTQKSSAVKSEWWDGVTVFSNNDTLFLLGGWHGGPVVTDSIFYSVNDGSTWINYAGKLPFAVHSLATAASPDGWFYIMGGDNLSTSTQQKSCYRTRDFINWDLRTSSYGGSERIMGAAWSDDFGNIYWAGGQSDFVGTGLNDIWKTTDGGLTWSQVASGINVDGNYFLGQNISKLGVYFNGRVYIVGGGKYDYTNPTDTLHTTYTKKVYSASLSNITKWRRENDLPFLAGRQYNSVAVWDGKIWSVNGYNGFANTDSVAYMSKSGEWTLYNLSLNPTASHAGGLGIHKDRLFYVHGYDNNGAFMLSRSNNVYVNGTVYSTSKFNSTNLAGSEPKVAYSDANGDLKSAYQVPLTSPLQVGVGTMVLPTTTGFNTFSSSSGASNGINITNTATNGYMQSMFAESSISFGNITRWNSSFSGNLAGTSVPLASMLQIQSGNSFNSTLAFTGNPIIGVSGTNSTNAGFRLSADGFYVGANSNLHNTGFNNNNFFWDINAKRASSKEFFVPNQLGLFSIGNYGTISETGGGWAYITGNSIKADLSTINKVVKTSNDQGQFMRMRYDQGISFHTNLTGSTGTSYADDANQRMLIDNTGNINIGVGKLLFSTDNTQDIGVLGSTRPRTGYFGTSVFASSSFLNSSVLRIGSSAGDITLSSSNLYFPTNTNLSIGGASTASKFVITDTKTATANNEVMTQSITGTLTARSTASDVMYSMRNTQVFTAAANNQTIVGLSLSPTLSVGAFTGTLGIPLEVKGANGEGLFRARTTAAGSNFIQIGDWTAGGYGTGLLFTRPSGGYEAVRFTMGNASLDIDNNGYTTKFVSNGGASLPALQFTGNPYSAGTATTNHPLLYMNGGTAPTSWSTAGTYFGINAVSGFTGNFLDMHLNGGTSVFTLDRNGNLATSGLSSAAYFRNANNNFHLHGSSTGTGALTLYNGAESDAAILQFGGTGTSQPSLVRNGTGIDVKLADNSAYTTIRASQHIVATSVFWSSGAGSPEGVLTANIGSLYSRTDGGAGTSLYVKESGTGNTGWVAK